MVYARKQRSVVMSDTYSVSYSSKTSGSNKVRDTTDRHCHCRWRCCCFAVAVSLLLCRRCSPPPPPPPPPQELLVSKRHLHEDDRVLLVDDFLSSGAAQEALMRIVGQAEATPVGVAVLLEKQYEAGRMFLSGYGCNVESLVRVLDVNDGSINVAKNDDDLHLPIVERLHLSEDGEVADESD